MSFKFIYFLVVIVYSIDLQGSVSFVKGNRIKNNREVFYSQNVNYKIETYSQKNWMKNNSLFNDFISYYPPVEKIKNKRKFRKKRYKKTKKNSGFWSSLWFYIGRPILGAIIVSLTIGVILSPLVFVILGVVLGLSYFLILAIVILAAMLIASTLSYLIEGGYTLYASLLANVYLLILSLVFLIWGAMLAFPMLWIAGLILLLAILGLSLLIYLVYLL
jgi:hypothetical protein